MIFADRMARLGTESAFVVLARAQALAAKGQDIINLGIGQPDFRTPEHIVEAGIQALKDGHHGYTPANGLAVLREAVAADLEARHGAKVDPDCVVVVPGGKPTMFFAVMMFGQPGAEILYPNPGFPIYESVIRFSGATPVPMALEEANGFSFSAETVLGQITDRTRLIIINSPANPTGGVTPRAEIDRLVAGLAEWPDVAILSDEIYSRMLYGGREHVSLLQYPEIRDRLIVLDGWSKTYAMTGWRMGFSLWPEGLIDKARKLAVNAWSCVNAPAQFGALAALTGPQTAVADMVREFDGRRKVTVDGLNAIEGISCRVPLGAFYAFPNIKQTGWKAKALASALLEETGVATIGGPDFGVLGEGYIRLSYANSTDNIRDALGRIEKFLNENRKN